MVAGTLARASTAFARSRGARIMDRPAMSERERKLRRLDAFKRRVPHASASALSAILEESRRDLPEVRNRNAIRQARDLIMRGSGEYGALLTKLPVERTDGSVDHFCVVSPFAFLSEACAAGGGFAKAMQRIIAERPPSMDAPWDLVVYSDEVVPGNQLSGHNQRKVWAVYISFVQLGPLLTDEDAWICLVCERTDK